MKLGGFITPYVNLKTPQAYFMGLKKKIFIGKKKNFFAKSGSNFRPFKKKIFKKILSLKKKIPKSFEYAESVRERVVELLKLGGFPQ